MPVIWKPQERQLKVMTCPHEEILYGGAAGAGKSFLLVLDWLTHWKINGKRSNGVLFRNTYGELEDIKKTMEEVYADIGARWREKDFSYAFPDGATLKLAYMNCFNDALKHKGFSYTWRAHDELTQMPTEEEYIYLFSRMRSAHGIKIRTIATSNPDGPGHLWVKKRFKIDQYPFGMKPIHSYVLCDEEGTPIRMLDEEESTAYDGLSGDQLPSNIRRKTRIFIPGRLSDNEYYERDGDYRATLLALPEAKRRMLLDGRWDVMEGSFFDEWNPVHHVIKAFTPPKSWKRWMSGDWGTTAPYAFGWFCQSPSGEVYLYRELYGCKPNKTTEGVRESPATVAERIFSIEQNADEIVAERWIDASCFDNYEMGTSVSEQFKMKGIHFQPSQKKFKSGSIALFRDYLKVTNGVCRFKIMDNCVHTIRTLPSLIIDKHNVEQYDTDGEDHCVDMILYGIRRNLKTRDELIKERGSVDRNLRLVKRFGAFGAH